MANFEGDQSDSKFEISDQYFFNSENEHLSENRTVNTSSNRDLDDDDDDDDIFSVSNQSKTSSLNSYLETSNSGSPTKNSLLYNGMGEEEDLDVANGVTSLKTRSNDRNEEYLPSKDERNVARSLFRTPSCDTQTASPILSTYRSSPSIQRNIPPLSRHGTPTSYSSSSKVTPSRLKPKRSDPLVLLHLNVMPLNYTYSFLISSPDLPDSLQSVRENWRLLQDKIGDTVIERGVLLAHPQDSYETLEERLLEALELPVYPRARILKCGHYIGSSESETTSSDEGAGRSISVKKPGNIKTTSRKWCDICGRNIRLQEYGDPGNNERRFCIKIYASNGLMSACAWAAAWREMERVDVEIEPYVAAHLHAELERIELTSQNKIAGINSHEPPKEKIMTNITVEHRDDFEKWDEGYKAGVDFREKLERETTHQRVPLHEEEYEHEARQNLRKKDNFRHIGMKSQQNDDYQSTKYQASNYKIGKSSNHGKRRNGNYNQYSLSERFFTIFQTILRDRRNILIGLLAAFNIFLAFTLKNSTMISAVDNGPDSVYIATTLKEGTSNLKLDVPTSTIVREITVTQIIPVPSTVVIKNVNAQSPETQSVPETQTPDVSTEDQKLSKELIEVYSIPDLE